jgi:hypothetical protein
MLGAPAGGFGAGGHHGLEPATVLPMVPPNALSPPALMRPLPLQMAAAVDPPFAAAAAAAAAVNR